MPALGFERFLGHKELGGTKQPPYQSDPDLARRALRILDEDGPETFLFLITMGNHGPWLNAKLNPAFAAQLDPAVVPQMTALFGYLDGLRRCDEMLRILMDGLSSRYPNAVLALYGDHLPSLPRAFEHFGFTDLQSDYVIWPGGGASPRRIDMPVHRLGQALVDTALGHGWQTGAIRAAQ
jgi:phosphoglycerol transferase MdoB-like AlkP superfamily enzyme